MDKVWNNKAWIMVMPVILLVSFNAIIPLITVINYSLQDTFGGNVFFWVGIEWFEELLQSERFFNALKRSILFSVIVLIIEVPLGVFIALAMPKSGWANKSNKIRPRSKIDIWVGFNSKPVFGRTISHAVTTTKLGFINSEGCIDQPIKLNHRRAPLASTPFANTASIKNKESTKTTSASLQAPKGERRDTTTNTKRDGPNIIKCRYMK